jgi:gamma-glutamylputrescine oxidase
MAAVEHVPSWYAATARGAHPRPVLQESLRADVCVIGAGYTGVSAALHLAERGYTVVVLEAARIGWGASGRNGGELFVGQRKHQHELEAMFGAARARQLWDLGLEAVDLVCERVRRHDIQCDLRPGVVVAAAKRSHVPDLRRNLDNLGARYGYARMEYLDPERTAALIGTRRYHGALLDRGSYHLHALNLCLGMAAAAEAAGARFFEQSAVLSYTRAAPAVVRTAAGDVRADHVVLACNGYLERLEPRIAGHALPINNYVAVTEPLGESGARAILAQDVSVSDTKFVVYYWRMTSDHRLLFGGGENYSPRFPADIPAFVRPHLEKVYPQLRGVRLDHAWGGTLAVTMKRLPHFGRLTPNVFFAQGYSGQGVALANLAGKLIAEAVAGTAERFDVMASLPTPAFPGGVWLRYPALVLGMFWYAMLDRL